MAGSKTDYADQYKDEENLYWEQLRQEFNQYKIDLEATNVEIAEGLGISRQPLVSFMQDSSRGLPIRRSNLIQLWYLLTDGDRLNDKKISIEAKSYRQRLHKQGPDKLLKAAGFLPRSGDRILEVEPSRYQQIQRIASRLSNLPIAINSFIELTNNLEDEIRNRTFQCLPNEFNQDKDWSDVTQDKIKVWVKDRINYEKPNSKIIGEIRQAIAKLVILGKRNFNDVEMFELYSCISENEKLGGNVNKIFKQIRILDCQFKTLTFSIENDADSEEEIINLKKAGFEAEKHLREELSQLGISGDDMKLDPVIETSVRCNFGKRNQDIYWKYGSAATHFENMLAAVAQGLGYRSKLKLIDFVLRALGSLESTKETRLVKASVVLSEISDRDGKNNQFETVYPGLWIDLSMFTSILQSVVFAVRGWLSEQLADDSSNDYYEVCQAVAEIEEGVSECQKQLSGYVFNANDRLKGHSVNSYLEEKVIDRIQNLQRTLLKEKSILADFYSADLERQFCLANLLLARSAHVQVNMTQAAGYLSEVSSALKRDSIKSYKPILILYNLEEMVHKFFSGDEIFFADKQWRTHENYNRDKCLEVLRKYIQQGNLKYGSYPGRLDFDTYLCASEIFARSGRLDFCLELKAKDKLKEARENCLMAAHCAAKIGLRLKAAHYLANASRICCRIGDGDRAEKLANLTERVIKAGMQPTAFFRYQEAILAEVNLARGERLLLINEDYKEALEYFLLSLKSSIYLGFARLISETLYDIARVAEKMSDRTMPIKFWMLFDRQGYSIKNELEDLKKEEMSVKTWEKIKVADEVIKFFLNDLGRDAEWDVVAKQCKKQATKIWHQWFEEANPGKEGKHPIEDLIDSGKFLCTIE